MVSYDEDGVGRAIKPKLISHVTFLQSLRTHSPTPQQQLIYIPSSLYPFTLLFNGRELLLVEDIYFIFSNVRVSLKRDERL